VFRTTRIIAPTLSLLCFVLGCAPKVKAPDLAKIKGTVTLDGQPMASGEITFVVLGKHTALLPVTGGTFSGEVSVGANRVEVYSYKEGGEVVEMGGQKYGGGRVNVIPAKFNADSTLKAEVAPQGANEFKFEVTSQ
jgi:hypothetical protein